MHAMRRVEDFIRKRKSQSSASSLPPVQLDQALSPAQGRRVKKPCSVPASCSESSGSAKWESPESGQMESLETVGSTSENLKKALRCVEETAPWVSWMLREFDVAPAQVEYASEAAYLKHVELGILLRSLIIHLSLGLYDSTTRPDKGAEAREDRAELSQRLEAVCELEASVTAHRLTRLEACARKPRLARLAAQYGFALGSVEARLFDTIAILATAQTDAGRSALIEDDNNRRATQLCRLAGASELEVEKFADADGEHVKENVVHVSDDADAYVTPVPPLRLSKIGASVVRGDELSGDELLKTAGTKLEVVLAEEGLVQVEEDEDDDPQRETINEAGSSNASADEAVGVEATVSRQATAEGARPYPEDNELEYLGEMFDIVALRIRLATAKIKSAVKEQSGQTQTRAFFPAPPDEGSRAGARELKAKIRVAEAKLAARCGVTSRTPRLVAMARKLDLDDFERHVVALLVGRTISPAIKALMDSMESSPVQRLDDATTVGALLSIFCPDSFQDQVKHRARFYKGARLVSRGVVRIGRSRWHSSGSTDLTESRVELDRRVLDYCVGLDTEINDLVEGSELYAPKFDFDDLVLPAKQKDALLSLCSAYDKLAPFIRNRQANSIGGSAPYDALKPSRPDPALRSDSQAPLASPYGELPAYGAGLIVLLTGPSGTGKTCTVHAVAKRLGKRVLQVDFQSLRGKHAVNGDDVDADLRGLFREAEMADAICLFDECEALFRSRDISGGADRLLRAMLQEIERYPGIVFLASNRPAEMDEALHRRISTVIEYRPPKAKERRAIWSKLSRSLKTAPEIDWDAIALKYELSGGFIKNALLSSLLLAIHRSGKEAGSSEEVVISESDIRAGCALQQRGVMYRHGTSLGERNRFSEKGDDDEKDPSQKRGLTSLALRKETRAALDRLVIFEAKRGVVFGTWGFGDDADVASICLLYGPKGAGKRTICAGIARDLDAGRGLYRVTARDVVYCPDGFGSSMHPAADPDSKTKHLNAVIDDARLTDSVLLIDGFEQALSNYNAESIADLTPSLARALDRLSRFPGVVLLVADVENPSMLRFASDFLRRISLALPINKPTADIRAKIWRAVVPRTAPLAEDVDFDRLGQDYDLLPTSIRRAAVSAAAQAERVIMQKHFDDAAKQEFKRLRGVHADAIDRLFM